MITAGHDKLLIFKIINRNRIMSTKTKKLSAGVPIVGSNGAVTPVSIAELAREVGKELGVQQAAYRVAGVKWIRIGRVDSNGGIVILKNFYANALSKGVVIAFTGAHNHLNCDAKILSGTPTIFDSLRFVANSGIVYLEIHSSLTGDNPWAIKLYSIAETQVYGSKLLGCELYQSLTEGEITQGYAAKELTLTDLQWGGVNTGLSSVYASLLTDMSGLSTKSLCITKSSVHRSRSEKGELRHEWKDKETGRDFRNFNAVVYSGADVSCVNGSYHDGKFSLTTKTIGDEARDSFILSGYRPNRHLPSERISQRNIAGRRIPGLWLGYNIQPDRYIQDCILLSWLSCILLLQCHKQNGQLYDAWNVQGQDDYQLTKSGKEVVAA